MAQFFGICFGYDQSSLIIKWKQQKQQIQARDKMTIVKSRSWPAVPTATPRLTGLPRKLQAVKNKLDSNNNSKKRNGNAKTQATRETCPYLTNCSLSLPRDERGRC